ncbi:MAG: phosphomannomutase, partial [Anaerolineae bacterium]|nr:phosphomannomutase [Anaerolineae bacterium]
VIGGELSGHIFFNDPPFVFDDALYAAALLLQYMDHYGASARRPLSQILDELLAGLPRYISSPEIRISCPDYAKWDVVNAVRDTFASRYRVIDIDGARIYFGDSDWALIRASNTSPKLSLRFEARTEADVKHMKEMVRAELARHLPDVPAL